MITPQCPQCHGTEFVTISPTLSRCADCRWLVRLTDNGVETAYPLFGRTKRRARRRAMRTMQILDDLEDK